MGDGFKVIRLRIATIERYKGFSKKMTKSYSETLDVIMDFFEWHGISPFRRFAKQISDEENKTRKRIDAVIAIIKNIEKSQTKPTTAMLQSLFEEKLIQEESEMIETKFTDKAPEEKLITETTIPKIRYERLEDKMNSVKEDFTYVLDNVKIVKSNFGKGYLKLELTEEELAKYKRVIQNL